MKKIPLKAILRTFLKCSLSSWSLFRIGTSRPLLHKSLGLPLSNPILVCGACVEVLLLLVSWNPFVASWGGNSLSWILSFKGRTAEGCFAFGWNAWSNSWECPNTEARSMSIMHMLVYALGVHSTLLCQLLCSWVWFICVCLALTSFLCLRSEFLFWLPRALTGFDFFRGRLSLFCPLEWTFGNDAANDR